MKIFQPTAGGGGGGGTIGGFISANYIAYGTATNTIGGDGNATRIGSGAFQTNVQSGMFAQGADNESNLHPNGLYQADNVGTVGNAIVLTFNGTTDTYASVLSAWNGANPSNTATLIRGNGTDVPDAQTIQFAAGGQTGFTLGTVGLGGGNTVQGSAFVSVDPTNGDTAMSGAVDFDPLTGDTTLSGVLYANGTAGLGGVIASQDGVIIVNTDGSTYQSQLVLRSDGSAISYNNLNYFVNGTDGIGWQDNHSGNTYILPTSTVPTMGQVLGVTGISGPNYTLDFVNGGGGGGTVYPNQQIVFGDGSTAGGVTDPNFTWDSPGLAFRVQNGTGTTFFVDAGAYSGQLGDTGGHGNHTLLSITDSNSVISASGSRADSTPALVGPTFTGSGLNDLTADASGYNNITSSVTVTATVDDVGIFLGTLSGIASGPDPVAGDSFTNGTGGNATVLSYYEIAPAQFVISATVTSGSFTTGDTLSSLVAGWTTNPTSLIETGDTATITDTSSMTLNLYPLGYGRTNNGIVFGWGSVSGHTITDEWSFTVNTTYVYGTMLNLDGQQNVWKMGDLDNVAGGTKTVLSASLGIQQIIGTNAAFSVQDVGTGQVIGAAFNSGNPTITVGAFGYGNDTGITVNDADQSIILNTQGQLTTQSNTLFNVTNDFTLRNPANSTQIFMDANWNSGNPTFLIGGNGNGTALSLNDSSGVIRATTDTSFTVANTSGNLVMYAQNDGGDHRFRAGDVSGAYNGTLLDVSDSGQTVTVQAVNGVSIGDAVQDVNGTFVNVNDSSTSITFNFINTTGATYTFPNDNGTGALTNDGSGILTWVPGGTSTVGLGQVAFGDPSTGAITSDQNFLYAANGGAPLFQVGGLVTGNNTQFILDDSTMQFTAQFDSRFTFNNSSALSVMTLDNNSGSPIVTLAGFGGVSADRIALFDSSARTVRLGDVDNDFGGTLLTVDDGAQSYTFSKPNITVSTVPYVMPSFQGSASTVLINDGSGNLAWDFPLGVGQVNHVRKVTTSPDFVSGTDYCLLMDTTSTAFSETLPAATSLGRTYVIKDYKMNAGVNNIEIFPTGSDTIDFDSSVVISVNGGSVTLISDGTSNWSVI